MNQNSSNDRLPALIAALARIGADVADVPTLLQRTVDEVMQITGGNGAVIERVEDQEMIYLAAAGRMAPFIDLRLPREGSLSGLCVGSRSVQRCDDSESDPRVHREACRKVGARSMLIVPLVFADQVLGVLKVTSAEVQAFDAIDQQVLELAAPVIASALGREMRLQTERSEAAKLSAELSGSRVAEQTWRTESLTDALTGLANRRQFELWLEQASNKQSPMVGASALCFIDVNKFKAVNDIYGHEVGDDALRLVAGVLQQFARDSDRVARLAGDEFVVLLQPLDDPCRQSEWFARKVLGALAREPLKVDSQLSIPVSISIGIAVHSGPGLDRSTWLARADAAMYRAKHTGDGHFHVHQNELSATGNG